MDSFLRGLLDKEIKIGKARLVFLDLVLIAGITVGAAVIRFVLRKVITDDWLLYWDPWIRELRENGFGALAGTWYDYAPPFMYILYIISRLPINEMTAYKGLCCAIDFVAAIMAAKIVFNMTKNTTKAIGTYAVMLLVPTTIANSAMWAQCDIIYLTLVLFCVYYLLKENPGLAMLFYGISFAFKLQSLFIFPFLVVLWAKKKIKIQHFLYIPLMYFIGMIPAWLAGRPFIELINIYVEQGSSDIWALSLKWPNIYQIIGYQTFLYEYADAGVWLILGILMCIMFYMAYKKFTVTKESIIQMVLFFALLTPYFLPHMHERYGFMADIFAVIYGMVCVRRFYVPLIQIIISYAAYTNYLSYIVNVPLAVYAFVEFALIVVVGLDLYASIHEKESLVDRALMGGLKHVS